MTQLSIEIQNIKDRELVFKHSETGSGLVSLTDAIRALERLAANLINQNGTKE